MKKPKLKSTRTRNAVIDAAVLKALKKLGPCTVAFLYAHMDAKPIQKVLHPGERFEVFALKSSLNDLERQRKAMSRTDLQKFKIWFAVEVAPEVAADGPKASFAKTVVRAAGPNASFMKSVVNATAYGKMNYVHVGGVQLTLKNPGEGTSGTTFGDAVTHLHAPAKGSAFSSKIELADKLVALAEMIRASTTDYDGGSADVFVVRRYSTEALARLRGSAT